MLFFQTALVFAVITTVVCFFVDCNVDTTVEVTSNAENRSMSLSSSVLLLLVDQVRNSKQCFVFFERILVQKLIYLVFSVY